MTDKTQKDLLETRRNLLDEYEREIGLPENNAPGDDTELKDYLRMTRNQIEALDASTAISIAVRLSQFAFYFQRAMNREKANKTWAEDQLRRIVAREALQYDKYTPNKTELVCRENSAANQLQNIKVYAQQRIERLEEISSNLKSIGYTISLVAKNRMGNG